jgi:hypothetical protein
MNDTPETDAASSPHIGFFSCATVTAEFARRLERERDEAREIAYDLAVIASHFLGSHSFSLSETSERIADTLKRWRSTQPCKK